MALAIIGAIAWLTGLAMSRLSVHPRLEGVLMLAAGILLIGAGLASRRRVSGLETTEPEETAPPAQLAAEGGSPG
jgi:hypothetical protein